MSAWIRLLCGLSILCGLARSFCPEGSGKRALSFVCAAVLLAGFVRALGGLNWEAYSLETDKLRQRQELFLQQSEETARSLDRTVIEREYGAYIMDMAADRGMDLKAAKVSAQWSLEGLWLPWSVALTGNLGAEEQALLSAWIEADLGIPKERQEWRQHGDEDAETAPAR